MADTDPDYKATTCLPSTDFPMKANLAQREPERLQQWADSGLYDRMLATARGAPFLFHDGPPYANGHLHEGHFLNKILKDIVAKSKIMAGHRCEFIPGWDCHGLPIELAVDKELGSRKRELDKLSVRKACRAHAAKFIDIQREEFKRLGIFARWEAPYSTMDYSYEAQTVRELARVVRTGAVYRGKKPVFWCWNDRTALAEAEIEYQDDQGPSIYVGFDAAEDLGRISSALAGRKARFAIWTTTPWTLPANVAIAVNPDFVYVAYELRGTPTVVARDLLFQFLVDVAPEDVQAQSRSLAGETLDVAALAHPERLLGYADGRSLEGLTYRHPFLDRISKIVLGDHVTLEAGTGLVHTAPGHGVDDYEVGQRYGLPTLTPVDAGGVLLPEAGPVAGLFFEKANPRIEALLAESGHLLNPPGQRIQHSYPHCWRCKKPVILRATDQWFVSMATTALRERALAAVDTVQWIPSWGKDRIRGMLTSRPDWCISRQRDWGVPIPALYCESCRQASLDPVVLDHLALRFEKEGSDAWWEHPLSDLLPDGYRCGHCGGTSFTREQDILDVWFDSGVSQAAVARPRLGFPVDLYLEGSDQHRGWFQASLLCALGAGEQASPFRACLTHGFVVDGQGRKLSKSLGNSLDPQKMLRQHGAEIVRLWAASEDYRDDIRLSDEILARLSEAYRKVRNTLRYALGNLADFDAMRDAVDTKELATIDRYARARLHVFLAKARAAYLAYEFHGVARLALDFCTVELSALYFDVSKDRLYCDARAGHSRRSAQTVMAEIADVLCRTLCPILSFTAEEAYAHLPGRTAESVFLAGFPDPDPSASDPELEAQIGELLALREDVQLQLEALRREKVIGSSQAARVEIFAGGRASALRNAPVDLGELFIVSGVDVLDRPPAADAAMGARSGLPLRVLPARGRRCDRCWNHREAGEPRQGGFVCSRCVQVLGNSTQS